MNGASSPPSQGGGPHSGRPTRSLYGDAGDPDSLDLGAGGAGAGDFGGLGGAGAGTVAVSPGAPAARTADDSPVAEPARAKPISVVLAADDRFARPLAATARSIVANLRAGRTLDLYLCDMGIAPRNRAMVAEAAAHPDVRVEWVTTLKEKVEHLPQTWPGITRAAYARLYIPSVLPAHQERALYLDCDLIARRCVGDLFDTPLRGHAALGVADAASPFVSSPYGVPFWHRYGRRADETYFNSGVLLMNLARWRDEDLAGAAFAYLTDGRHKQMVDQEAINAVLPGQIGHLDPRWNQQTEHFIPKFQYTLPYSEQTLADLVDDPWIVHFTTGVKAWSYRCKHRFRDEWFAYLDQTPYRGWRPSRGAYWAGMGGKLARAAKGRLASARA